MDDNTEREQGTDQELINWIDLGAEDEGRHLRETQERTRATIQSAIERGVIPDIWKLPSAELYAFQYGLRQMMIAQIRNRALRPLGEAGDYTDAELREAWGYVDNPRQQTAGYQYSQLMQQGLVPDPAKVDTELYSYYIKAAMDRITLPAKPEEFVKVWADVQAEWREQRAAESVPLPQPIPDNLTSREKEVAELVAQGLLDKEIAERLVIATETVRTNRKNIAEKWGMTTTRRNEMTVEARRRGYENG